MARYLLMVSRDGQPWQAVSQEEWDRAILDAFPKEGDDDYALFCDTDMGQPMSEVGYISGHGIKGRKVNRDDWHPDMYAEEPDLIREIIRITGSDI